MKPFTKIEIDEQKLKCQILKLSLTSEYWADYYDKHYA